MLVKDILCSHQSDVFRIIQLECSQFIAESQGMPLYRLLPTTYGTMYRVKVRQHKRIDEISAAFNQAFCDEYRNIIPRGVLANPRKPCSTQDYEPYYIFPINGYKYTYNNTVESSSSFKRMIELLSHDKNAAIDLTTDVIRHTYTNTNLCEGIRSNSEIIIYNIPYFYAVNACEVQDIRTVINN